MSSEIRKLTVTASRSVVEIEVTSLGGNREDRGISTISRQQGLGSGVIIDPAGYIVTNAHVVAGAFDVKVLLNSTANKDDQDEDGTTKVEARILGLDRESDLALLKVEAKGLIALPFAPLGTLEQGDLVLAIGNPLGLRNSVSLGVVSATARMVNDNNPLSYIQTDASINPGNSGGALVDAQGRLVGINTFILTQSGGNEGLGFAIPSSIVQDVCAQLRKEGRVTRGEVGVLLEDITPTLQAGLGLTRSKGLLLGDVIPDSPADKAGLKIGDIILRVNSQRADSVAHFRSFAYFKKPGETLKVEFQRGPDTLKAEIVTRARQPKFEPLSVLAKPEQHLIPRLGVLGLEIDKALLESIQTPMRDASGVIVAGRTSEGLGQVIDLQAGDVIHALNGTAVVSLDYLKQAIRDLKPASPVVLQIEREGRMQFIAFTLE